MLIFENKVKYVAFLDELPNWQPDKIPDIVSRVLGEVESVWHVPNHLKEDCACLEHGYSNATLIWTTKS